MLRPDAIWAIHGANRSSTSAEAIAWQAVDNGMPGECEGYPPCELATLDALDGEYLRQHPDGAHAADAITRIRETCRELERLLAAPNGHELFDPVLDCKDLKPTADAVERALQGARTDATEALAALRLVRERCGGNRKAELKFGPTYAWPYVRLRLSVLRYPYFLGGYVAR